MNYTNGLFDCQSPTSPFLGSLRVLHLLEDLRTALDLMDPEEKQSLRSQVSETTAEGLMEWLQGRLVGFHQILLKMHLLGATTNIDLNSYGDLYVLIYNLI